MLPVIPTPAGTRWREFRINYLPVLVFIGSVVLVWQLWLRIPPPSAIRGIGDGAVAQLASPEDGFIEEVRVANYGWTEAGQSLLTIVPFDPRSNLDLFQSQLQVSRILMEPSLADRTSLDYEQVRVDYLRLKQELAMAKANLDRALKTLPRHETLMKEGLLSKDVYELTVRDRDFYQAEVDEKTKAIQEIQGRLEELQSLTQEPTGTNGLGSQLGARLEEQLASVQTNWNPIVLQAPIGGEVQFYRRAGEFVRAGDPLLVINAPRAERIIAYLKQPLPFEPAIGMTMEVISRTPKRKRFLTQIAQIGARVDYITNAVAYIQYGALVDTGLPLILPVPEGAEVRPGELVDVILKSPRDNVTIRERLFGDRTLNPN